MVYINLKQYRFWMNLERYRTIYKIESNIWFKQGNSRQQNSILKEQCHEIFDNFFLLKRFDPGPIWTGINSFMNIFIFLQKIFAKIVSPHSQGLRRHGVSVVKDYTDMCQHGQWLRRHCVNTDTQEIILLWKK